MAPRHLKKRGRAYLAISQTGTMMMAGKICQVCTIRDDLNNNNSNKITIKIPPTKASTTPITKTQVSSEVDSWLSCFTNTTYQHTTLHAYKIKDSDIQILLYDCSDRRCRYYLFIIYLEAEDVCPLSLQTLLVWKCCQSV